MDIKCAWITTNRSCNNQCLWCYAKNADDSVMNIEEAKNCVDSLSQINVKSIVLIGGEPTIYKHFIELVKYIHDKEISVSIATNGRNFSDYEFTRKSILAGVSGINISIKACSEEDYRNLTGCKGFNEMILGYKNLCSLGFNPTLSYVITDNDFSTIERIIYIMKNHKMDNIIFQFVKPVIEQNSERIMSMDQMGEYVEKLYYRIRETDIRYKIEISFPLCLIKANVLEALISEERITTCCHIQSGHGIVIDTDFKILPCNHFVGFPYSWSPTGKMGIDAFKELWNSEMVVYFRNKTRCYPSKICENCSTWDICGGGCFTRWLFEDPKSVIKSCHNKN